MASSSADLPDLLCLIVSTPSSTPRRRAHSAPLFQLDLNPIAWAHSAISDESHDALSLEQAIEQVLIFCNALLALRHENELAVFAAGLGKRCVAHPTESKP